MSEKIVIRKGEGNALAVIDGQDDFVLETGALYVAGVAGEATNEVIIGRILNLSRKPFDHMATSEDDHPENHAEFDLYGKHCVNGSSGQCYHRSLWHIYSLADEHLKKGQDRALMGISIATSPQFAEHIARLRRWGIKRIFVTGWAYTHCVGEAAIAYATQGFEVYVVRDAARSVPPPYGDPESMDKKLELYGVKLILAENIE